MRAALKQLAWSLGIIVAGGAIGALCAAPVGWLAPARQFLAYAAACCVLVGAVFLLFSVRDVICAALSQAGRPADRDRVFIHLCAGVMALISVPAFLSADPRVHGVRWMLLVLLPGSLYFLSFAIDRINRVIERALVWSVDRTAKKRRRRR